MAEQWQLRKGSTAENEGFIGAEGELTYDTTTKAVHVHDGETAGGALIDAVVAYQLPTAANNYTWYRKYASGWVEQGGHIMATTSAWASTTITLPVTMANRYYCISRAGNWSDAASSSCTITAMTTTTFTITYALNTMDYGGTMWEVKGIAA